MGRQVLKKLGMGFIFAVALCIGVYLLWPPLCGNQIFSVERAKYKQIYAIVYAVNCGVTSDINKKLVITADLENITTRKITDPVREFSGGEADIDVQWRGDEELIIRGAGGNIAGEDSFDKAHNVRIIYE